jgi:predicted TIM-barrel fold metal-dependent hydrolase
MSRIDTHQHLIYPERFTYDWAEDAPALAGRAFTLEDYHMASEGCGITGSLFMEVDVRPEQAAAESAFICKLAEDPANRILGVIASGRPENPGFAAHLETLRHPRLVGLRRILHTQPDELSRGSTFRENVANLGGTGLTFDICTLARQLPVATELIDSCPDTQFILDHCGIPDVATGFLDPWRADLRELSLRPNVVCKISGIIANADPANATTAALRPFIEHTIECFGWDRLIFGGDWPVCNLTASFQAWSGILDDILASVDPSDRAKLDHLNARRVYRLPAF